MIIFERCLLITMFNIFKIDLININSKIIMIKNIIVLNIYNLMKIDNLLIYFKRWYKLNTYIIFVLYNKWLIGNCIKMIEYKIVF